MLVLRRYADNLDFLPFYQFPQKVMPHVNVLRVRVRNRVLRDLDGTLLLSSCMAVHGILAFGNIKHQT